MKLVSRDGEEDHEHNDVGFVEISEIFAMQDSYESYEIVYHFLQNTDDYKQDHEDLDLMLVDGRDLGTPATCNHSILYIVYEGTYDMCQKCYFCFSLL